ncbi:MAG: hypothetical protein AB7I19_04760 [Planctomycetota bacterium]
MSGIANPGLERARVKVGQLTVRVLDSKSAPLSTAQVAVRSMGLEDDWELLGDAGDGRFALPPLSRFEGNLVQVQVVAPGFLPHLSRHQVPVSSSPQDVIEVVLLEPAVLDVMVRYSDGSPATGVRVCLLPTPGNLRVEEISPGLLLERAILRRPTEDGTVSFTGLQPDERYVCACLAAHDDGTTRSPALEVRSLLLAEGRNSEPIRLPATRIRGAFLSAIRAERGEATLLSITGVSKMNRPPSSSLSGKTISELLQTDLGSNGSFEFLVHEPGRYAILASRSADRDVWVGAWDVDVTKLGIDIDLGQLSSASNSSVPVRVDLDGLVPASAIEDSRLAVRVATGRTGDPRSSEDLYSIGFHMELAAGVLTTIHGLPNLTVFFHAREVITPAKIDPIPLAMLPSWKWSEEQSSPATLVVSRDRRPRVSFVVHGADVQPTQVTGLVIHRDDTRKSVVISAETVTWNREEQVLHAFCRADSGRYRAVFRWRAGEAFVTAAGEFDVFDADVSSDVRPAACSMVEFSVDTVNISTLPVLSFGFVGSDEVISAVRPWSDGIYRIESVPEHQSIWVYGLPKGDSIRTADRRITSR